MKKRKAHNKLPLNEPYIIEQYNLGRSTNDIANELGVSGSAISRRLTALGIQKRKLEYNISGEDLRHMYIDQKLGIIPISKHYGCGKTHINKLLKKYGIPIRKNAGDPAFSKEERILKYGMNGSEHPRWKGGVTALNDYLRKASHDWRDAKMAQANYKCWITNAEAPRLNVHHAEPWHLLRDEAMRKAGIYGLEFVGDCAPEQLEECYEILTEIHRTLNGYVLDERLHVLFHSVYGYKVSDADIHEFKARYLSGEFE